MQLFSTLTLLASLLISTLQVASQLGCYEASRYGLFEVVPSPLTPGDVCLFHFCSRLVYSLAYQPYTITATFNCSAYFGIYPVSIDYQINVDLKSDGYDYETVVLLARHAFPTVSSGQVPVDQFNGTVSTV